MSIIISYLDSNSSSDWSEVHHFLNKTRKKNLQQLNDEVYSLHIDLKEIDIEGYGCYLF